MFVMPHLAANVPGPAPPKAVQHRVPASPPVVMNPVEPNFLPSLLSSSLLYRRRAIFSFSPLLHSLNPGIHPVPASHPTSRTPLSAPGVGHRPRPNLRVPFALFFMSLVPLGLRTILPRPSTSVRETHIRSTRPMLTPSPRLLFVAL
ncbi:hypothetical protein LZ32DRAFT_158509 [Colletotrichum eremochloae]|nr:hypothetical protein LZ32DRAFT_158509 [Colletotrichum eremochloae]